jgi:hypothetical protein
MFGKPDQEIVQRDGLSYGGWPDREELRVTEQVYSRHSRASEGDSAERLKETLIDP